MHTTIDCYGDSIGPLAMISYQPGQIRKEAAIVVTSCAGVWLIEKPPLKNVSLKNRSNLERFFYVC